LLDFNQSKFFRQIFEKYSPDIKFHANPSSARPVVACWRTDGDTTKLRVAFLNFAKAPTNEASPLSVTLHCPVSKPPRSR